MYRRIFAVILAVGVGTGIGVLTATRLASNDPPIENLSHRATESLAERLTHGESSEIDAEQVAQAVESLIRILDEEISERRILEERLEEVQSELADLQQNLHARVEEAFAANARNTASQQPGNQVGQTMEERLAAAGFTPQQFEAMRRREAAAQMQQVELDDQARREGWVNTPRYYEELANLTNGTNTVRLDFGDDAYDRYLFANGRPNRIAVGAVMETSPAEQAGFKVGDVIKNYGGERVFSSQQLNRLRSAGDKGVPVTVEIIRDGELMQISIPRGPMGLQTRPTVADPNAPDRD